MYVSNDFQNEISRLIKIAYDNEDKILKNYGFEDSEIDHISINTSGFVIDIKNGVFRKYLSFEGFKEL